VDNYGDKVLKDMVEFHLIYLPLPSYIPK
jgi:hypothetical protein